MPTPLSINSWIRGLDLMTLRLFASIAEEHNIARAAGREAIAASAVTKRMQDLEDTLGFKLLYRDSKGTTLTPVGELVYEHARAMLDSLAALHRRLSAFSEGVQGHVRVWVTEAALVEYLAYDIATFNAAFPGVAIDIQEADSTEVFRALTLGTADIGVCAQRDDAPAQLQSIAYRKDRLVALMTRSHPLAQRSSLSFAELLDADLIGWTEHTGLMRTLRRAAETIGREFKPKYRVASSQGARSLVRAGLGIAVHPEGTVWPYEDAERMVSIRLTDAWASRQLAIFLEAERPPSAATQTFIRHLSTTDGSSG
jgi:DNA-binding transcriptional LysR family regulator